MSLIHSRVDQSDRKVLLATAGAIRSLEIVTGTTAEYRISLPDAQDFHYIMQRLRGILENNGYTIDRDTNRLRRSKP